MKPLSIEEHVRRCLGPMQPVAVYLFGSAAAGSMREGSDVDVAILPRDRIDPVFLFEKQTELAERLGREEHGGRQESLENLTRQDSIDLNLQRACEAAETFIAEITRSAA